MGKEMAAQKAQELKAEIRQFVGQLRQKVYPEGHPEWGTLFSDIEELGVQIGDAVAREFTEQSVAGQAEAAAEREHRCPSCGGPVEARDPEPRPLLTRRGEIAWLEPQAYCGRCRKAFFPSVAESGHCG
ncbi:MAG: hypothetical protein K6T59_15530 [Bryobacteraceae bacterium]|nr:hypothetical protein [Bryobacteraceae bacterium]